MAQLSPSKAPARPTGADAAIAHLKALLRLDTTNPPGNERPAIDYVAARLREAGIEPDVFEPAPGRANLVARLKGDGSAGEPLLLTSHVDVVQVERERWSVDPFGAVEKDGCIWGRGTIDMKGLTAFELETFLSIRRSGAPLRRDLILLVLCDEEAGMTYGSRWMVENEPDRIRAGYALNEFGGFTVPAGGQRLYPIQVAEKGHLWLRAHASGDPGHGSIPHERNAVVRLAEAIARFAKKPLAYKLHPAARGFLEEAARAEGGVKGGVLKGLLHPLTAAASLAVIQRLDPERGEFFRAMLHETATPTGLRAGEKENVIPSGASATLDGRFLPGTSVDRYLALVQEALGPDIRLEVLSRGDPSEAPAEGPLWDLLCAKIKEHDPEGRPCPWLTVGYTDGANLSRLGTRCYGFYPLRLPDDIKFAKMVHGHDERVPVDGYRWGYRVFEDVVRTFVT